MNERRKDKQNKKCFKQNHTTQTIATLFISAQRPHTQNTHTRELLLRLILSQSWREDEDDVLCVFHCVFRLLVELKGCLSTFIQNLKRDAYVCGFFKCAVCVWMSVLCSLFAGRKSWSALSFFGTDEWYLTTPIPPRFSLWQADETPFTQRNW